MPLPSNSIPRAFFTRELGRAAVVVQGRERKRERERKKERKKEREREIKREREIEKEK
jgi:hypothetical protein